VTPELAQEIAAVSEVDIEPVDIYFPFDYTVVRDMKYKEIYPHVLTTKEKREACEKYLTQHGHTCDPFEMVQIIPFVMKNNISADDEQRVEPYGPGLIISHEARISPALMERYGIIESWGLYFAPRVFEVIREYTENNPFFFVQEIKL